MKESKELLKKAGIVPRLELARQLEGGGTRSTGPHIVKVLDEKIVVGKDFQTGAEREEMKYLLEEAGEKKTYSVPVKDKNGELHYLIQRFAEIEPGEEIILEAKKKGIRTYIDLQRVNNITGKTKTDDIPVVEDDIPVVNENEQEQNLNDEGWTDTSEAVENPQSEF
jgi:hypothetical protein